MMPDCTHQVETLRHGLVALAMTRLAALTTAQSRMTGAELGPGYTAGLLAYFRYHEAHEVGLDSEAAQLLETAITKNVEAFTGQALALEDEFVKRAVAALVQCECQRGPG